MAVRCSALILPSKPLLVFANIGRKWAGSVPSTSRVTNSINRCPQDTATLSSAMKYYTSTTEFNCGIDLHARQMYVCVMDRQGKKLVHTNVKNNDFDYFLKLVQPYRHDLTVCCECMFGWYWLADACQAAGLTLLRCVSGPRCGPSSVAVLLRRVDVGSRRWKAPWGSGLKDRTPHWPD